MVLLCLSVCGTLIMHVLCVCGYCISWRTDYAFCFNPTCTVYHRELEVFSPNSLCFMSVLGGGTDIYPFSTQDPPVLGEGPPAILGESQLFRQFLLPHCYAVRAFGYGDEYKYEIVPGGDDYSGVL